MSKSTIIPEKIKLNHIEVINTYINDDTINKNLNFEFNIAHNTKHNLEDQSIKIELFINLLSSKEIGVKFHIDFYFQIEDLQNHYELDKDKNIPVFSGQFIATLLGISFSTSRGIIYQQLQETNFSKLILPVVSPSKMLDMRIEDE
ncbi:hypothetical protein [Psychroflexus halocasei]|uniref:Preprotein translocase subunit SecB n=1 Tax=Psychroflexus halocasei TaxID=908615 RepID=A0A1H3VGL6_9FLAO|nr:hypothetical protein [Psychroflexus halocasei]SDZ73328.1 hypothetical protein SAMN05421540_10155 [Psychroflexus halocasei]